MDKNQHDAKIQAGLVEGGLRRMVERVAGFQKAKAERAAAGKPLLITKERQRQEAEAAELQKFMDFTTIFGEYRPIRSMLMGEAGVLSEPKPFRYDIYTDEKGRNTIHYRNIQLWWPMRIIQQVYAWSERKVTIHG
jgi:hypothetical protein